MAEIRVGIVGVGNCCSALLQGLEFYRDRAADMPGLITRDFAGYFAADIRIVSAFDIDRRKIGKEVNAAIFEKPNCTKIFKADLPASECKVQQGYRLDSFALHVLNYPVEDRPDPADEIDADRAAAEKRIVAALRGQKQKSW